jgi:purine-binding chemotaxis protein CheW
MRRLLMSSENQIKKDSSELLQLVSFKIGNEEYGVDILHVQEINKMIQITKLPNAPGFVEGVINLRGRVIPVIDIRTRLHLEKRPYDKDTRIIVVELDKTTVGFIVDAVSEVLRIPVNITEAPPEIVSGADSEFIKAVGKLEDRLIILISLEKIIKETEKAELSKVA